MRSLPKSHQLISLFIVVLALVLRSYNFGNFPFGFDQVQIAQAATQIAQGDFTLIGPRTGPAEMFTGPLIYYLAAIFTVFMPSYYAVVATTLGIALVTGICIWFLSSRYLVSALRTPLLMLWAVSPFIIGLDRVPWNPNLAILAGAFTFFPLLNEQSKLSAFDSLLIAVGVFLGYQAHFSGLLLLPLAISSVMLFYDRYWPTILLILLGFAASLTPTLLFDLRNQWLNLNGFLEMISSNDAVSTSMILSRVWDKTYIVIETVGRILFEGGSVPLVLIAGCLCFAGFMLVREEHQERKELSLTLWWIIAVIAAFSLYRGSTTPEYYFLILVPAFLFLVSKSFVNVLTAKQIRALLIVLPIYGTLATYFTYSAASGLKLKHQLKAVSHVQEIRSKTPIKQIVFDMKPVDALGLQYLFAQEDIASANEGVIVHIAYPKTQVPFRTRQLSKNAVLWIDSRTDTNRLYLTTETHVLSFPKNWSVYQNQSHELKEYERAQAEYVVFDGSNTFLGRILVFDKDGNSDLWPQIPENQKQAASWRRATLLDRQVDISLHGNLLFVSTLQESANISIIAN